ITIEPPEAKTIPSPRSFHGDTVVDEYAWLADKDDPDTIDYLRAENEYTDELTAQLGPLRDQIFEEIKARTQESDLSVPVRKGGWWHYSRTVEGKQYAVYCRRAVRPGEVIPPMAENGKPLDGEEELLDGNELAAGHEFFSLGAFRTSPDQRWLAYSTDFAGNERFTLRIKDLATGATLPDEIPDTYASCAWSLDGSAVFYTTVDDAWRPYRVWRHRIGTQAAEDVMVFEEPDERFHVWVSLTRSESYVMIRSSSVLTSEVWLLDAADPSAAFSVVAPRRQGVDYDVEHAGDHLFILHLAGHPGVGLRLRHGHRRAHPAQAAAGAPFPVRRRIPARGLRAAPGVGRGRRRHPGADLAGLPHGNAARRQRAVPAVRLRQLRALPRPGLLHPRAVPARPRFRLRDRAHQGRRRDGPVLVHRRQAAAQEEHVHRLHRVRPAPGRDGLDVGGPAGGAGRF